MLSDQKHGARENILFGPFTLSIAERSLEKDGIAVPVGARALDILIVLAQRAGDVVSHRTLLDRVWPNISVADSALRVHINSLRRALGGGGEGARYVRNVSGRGYCIVGVSAAVQAATPWGVDEPIWRPGQNLPSRPNRMVGRDAVVRQIISDLLNHRFVTIVGPGGVGKTTVAAAVCHEMIDAFDGQIVFIDLGTVSDAESVLSTVRATLHLPTGGEPMAGLLSALRHNHLLLVLDCCEHVAQGAAQLTDRIFNDLPSVHVLATSREPLRAGGERLYHLSPLECPPEMGAMTAFESLTFSAVQLFVDRVSATERGFILKDADASVVASICRRVDGIALAIELAASRVGAYGIREVEMLLNTRLKLLWQGRRTAPPRQQTLSATLDWSFQLLSFAERSVLCHLSVFVGEFTLDAARAIAESDCLDVTEIDRCLGSLVDRSLISSSVPDTSSVYRLFDITRQYAIEKLDDADETNRLARRHAEYFHGQLTAVFGADPGYGNSSLITGGQVSNVRAALEWSFSPLGDTALGTRLVLASSRFFLTNGFVSDCKKWVQLALIKLEESSRGTHVELQLNIVLSSALTFSDYAKREVVRTRSIELALKLCERQQYITLLFYRHFQLASWGQPDSALRAALNTRNELNEASGALEYVISDMAIACIYCCTGQNLESNYYYIQAFARFEQLGANVACSIDPYILSMAQGMRSSNLYLIGLSEQAVELGNKVISRADNSADYITSAQSMASVAGLFEWCDDWATLLKIYNIYLRQSAGQVNDSITSFYHVLHGKLLLNSGDAEAAVQYLRTRLSELSPDHPTRLQFFTPIAAALIRTGRFDEALRVTEQALLHEATLERSGHRSEFLLMKAKVLASGSRPRVEEAEEAMILALEAARREASLARELKAALALAMLLSDGARSPTGLAILESVYSRFTEGFETKELQDAANLLKGHRHGSG